MENIFYIGSFMFTKSEGMRELIYIFSGARKNGDGWVLNITLSNSYGYGGGATTFNLDAKPGDVIRLHPKTKVFVSEPSTFKEKQKLRDARAMRIDEIGPDMLKVMFE